MDNPENKGGVVNRMYISDESVNGDCVKDVRHIIKSDW